MAQHDMNIANQGFPATRADLNNALQALATNSSGTSAPSTPFANQWWYDTTNNKLYIRNEANNAWIQVAVLDQTNNEWQITTGQISAADGDGLVFKTDDGNTRITLSDGGDVTFADGTDIITASAGTDNVRIGEGAGDSIASGGNNNVVIGKDAGTAITTGGDSVAIGTSALAAQTTGGDNVAIGHLALSTLTTAGNNVAVGDRAMAANTSGENNVAVGTLALDANTTGLENVAIGRDALGANTTGNYNTAVGRDALLLNTTGTLNVAVGHKVLDSTTTGYENVGIGAFALADLTTGQYNVAFGRNALLSATTNHSNVAGGYKASEVCTGSHNVTLGYQAGKTQTTGSYNTLIGNEAAPDITSASQYNTCVGSFAGNDMTDNAEFNVFIGYDARASSGNVDKEIVIGNQVNGVGTGYITIGNNSDGRVYNRYSSNASWTHTSDERMKKDIQTNTDCGLDFVNDLRTTTYKWKAPSEHPEDFLSYDADQTEARHTGKMYGFIAQEVKAAMDSHNITDFEGWHCIEDQGGQQGISYEMFVVPLVKAVQELSAKVDALEARIATLEG